MCLKVIKRKVFFKSKLERQVEEDEVFDIEELGELLWGFCF